MSNPFLALTPAQIDVLDDMRNEWSDKDRHGELNGGFGYGPNKSEALRILDDWIHEAWHAKVDFVPVEETP